MQQTEENVAKLKATANSDDPIFTPRERSALEMATIFTQRYQDFSDESLQRWRENFSDDEIIELAVFMALADGFGKVVEMLGLGQEDQVCPLEI